MRVPFVGAKGGLGRTSGPVPKLALRKVARPR